MVLRDATGAGNDVWSPASICLSGDPRDCSELVWRVDGKNRGIWNVLWNLPEEALKIHGSFSVSSGSL